MTAGRKPQVLAQVPALIDPTLDQSKLNQAMAQMRADGVNDQQARDERMARFSEQVGIAKFAGFQAEMCAAAQIRVFLEIKEANDFKDLPVLRADGNMRPAQTLDELCPLVFGKSYRIMAEHAQNLSLLGAAAFDAAERMGLKRQQLRLIRSLPETQQSAVKAAMEAESKGEVVALIEDLASQLAQANEAIAEAKEEASAQEALVTKLHAKNDKLARYIAKLTPDDKLLDLQKEATALMNDALGCVRGNLRQAIIAIRDHGGPDTRAEAHDVFLAGLLGQVALDIKALRDEFNLPDLSNAAELQLARDTEQWYQPAEDLPEADAAKPAKAAKAK